jgi:hypothetical protein
MSIHYVRSARALRRTTRIHLPYTPNTANVQSKYTDTYTRNTKKPMGNKEQFQSLLSNAIASLESGRAGADWGPLLELENEIRDARLKRLGFKEISDLLTKAGYSDCYPQKVRRFCLTVLGEAPQIRKRKRRPPATVSIEQPVETKKSKTVAIPKPVEPVDEPTNSRRKKNFRIAGDNL